jgi:uncharacterized membrane protein
VLAERFARFFGTPQFIISQTVIIVIWIAVNAAVVAFRWDPYPFILLNLVFSTQAAYAARRFEQTQAAMLAQDEQRTEQHARLLEQNTALTREVARLTEDLHAALIKSSKGSADE